MTAPRVWWPVCAAFLATVLWSPAATDAGTQGSVARDRAALEALYEATGGADWVDGTNWQTDAPLGRWHGVSTDDRGRVVALDLGNNGLVGPIPPELADLVHLERLSLQTNGLSGPLPRELAGLANLTDLHLRWNNLTGPVPAWLGSLPSLWRLDLGDNLLTGPIPRELGNLVNLEWLMLHGNALTGPVPAWLGRLANLRLLFLGYNRLTGPIPRELGNLVNLTFLALEWNALTGPIPASLGRLVSLDTLHLHGNELTGPIPAWLGSLPNLAELSLGENDLSGPVPPELAGLDLTHLSLVGNWGVSGPLPAGLRLARLEALDLFVTQACAPAAWRDRLAAIDFRGRLCGTGADVTIDVAVVYTPAAREAAGGTAAIEAAIDLRMAETNRAYEASGVSHRVALADRSEVSYAETGSGFVDIDRLANPSDGHMDGVHGLRDRVGADLVHLLVGESDVGGIALLGGDFGLSVEESGGWVFAHELGHNMGLRHERYQVHHHQGGAGPHPAFGYVNPRAFEPGAPASSCWATIMAYGTQCADAGLDVRKLDRFSNPRQRHAGEPLGVAWGAGGSDPLTGPADAAAVLNATGPAVALRRDRSSPAGANRPPAGVAGTLPDRTLRRGDTLDVDVSRAFVDPDGDVLAYTVSSSAPRVVTVRLAGSRARLTAVGEGASTIRVTAADPAGLRATQAFTVTVVLPAPFTDDPLVPGVTPIRAVHFTELRTRIDAVRAAAGLGRFAWTDPVLRAGVTRVRLVHLLQMRSVLAAAYRAAGRPAPRWADAAPTGGTTPIRAVHLTELRTAVLALE